MLTIARGQEVQYGYQFKQCNEFFDLKDQARENGFFN
jgi:hypothetical protein